MADDVSVIESCLGEPAAGERVLRVMSADVNDLNQFSRVSDHVASIEHRVASNLLINHVDFPRRIRSLQWRYVRTRFFVKQHFCS